MRKCKFQRKKEMEDPSIILSMLNSQVVDIKANGRFAVYQSSDGSLFVMGRDFRPQRLVAPGQADQDEGSSYGIPKFVSLAEKIHQVALGRNHVLMLATNGTLLSLGSNQFGQLGVPDSSLNTSYDHPMNLTKLFYTQQAV